MKDKDYLPDEMSKARDEYLANFEATTETFEHGWRAACEAWQAKIAELRSAKDGLEYCVGAWAARAADLEAKAGPERARPRYWAATVDRERPRYWRWNDNGTAEWIYPHRTEPSRYDLAWWDDMPPDLYIPCTTEAEARRVAGFPDPQPAPDWRAACVVEKCRDGDWDVVSPCGKFWMSRTGWHRFDVRGKQRLMAGYFLGGESTPRAALAACPVAPPDWGQP